MPLGQGLRQELSEGEQPEVLMVSACAEAGAVDGGGSHSGAVGEGGIITRLLMQHDSMPVEFRAGLLEPPLLICSSQSACLSPL